MHVCVRTRAHIHTHMGVLKKLMKKEVMNLKESKEGCVEGFRGKKGKGEM